MRLFLFVIVVVLCSRCATPNRTAVETAIEDANLLADIEREIGSPSLKSQALRFHQFVQGELGPQAESLLLRSCRKKNTNPFCYSIRSRERWAVYRRKRTIEPKPYAPKVIIPTPLHFENGNLTHWAQAIRSEKQSLIKALEPLDLATLQNIGRKALEEKRCPNTMAIAVAATLEDHFQSANLIESASILYANAARCRRQSSADRENFLVRAALLRIWRKEYSKAIDLLKRVNPSDAFAGRALYWLYRLFDETGQKTNAKTTYRRLRRRYPFSFHAIVAAAENGEDTFQNTVGTYSVKKAQSQSKHISQVLSQIRILKSYSLDVTASVLVDWLLGSHPRMPASLRLYLAELGDFKTKVSTVPELFIRHRSLVSEKTLQMAYPRAYGDFFDKYSGVTDPLLLMAISQKESKFDTLAQSPANARGLMQLSPETGARLAGRDNAELFDPETNIRLGARYVEELFQKWNGRGFLVLANYNAGHLALESWLRRFTTDDPLLFIDLIPYRETREYVGFVLTNYYWYRRLYRKEPVTKIVAPEIARR